MAKKAAAVKASQYTVPTIKEGQKVKGTILKEIENGVLVNCENGAFTGVILSKEAKELKRSQFNLDPSTELELEIINPSVRHEDGYYIVSVTRLLQYDVWKSVIAKFENDEIITVVPTEANLGGLLIDMHGIKGFIPLSQLAPIHYPRVEDGDQDAIFDKLLGLIGQEIKVRVINIDEEEADQKDDKLSTKANDILNQQLYTKFVARNKDIEGIINSIKDLVPLLPYDVVKSNDKTVNQLKSALQKGQEYVINDFVDSGYGENLLFYNKLDSLYVLLLNRIDSNLKKIKNN